MNVLAGNRRRGWFPREPNPLGHNATSTGDARAEVPATAASASASSSPASAYLTTKAKVTAVTKSIAGEAKYALAGCVINKSMTQVLKVAKLGKAPTVQLATATVKAANAQGNGFCKATGAIAKTVAYMWWDWYKYHKVYICQGKIVLGSWPWSKLTVTWWVGRDATHTVKISYTV
jgi:hypothetical protein